MHPNHAIGVRLKIGKARIVHGLVQIGFGSDPNST